ncbi:MAG: ParB/RepB/Spo0J family partition protein [Endomicrobium sp.]|jgi:ParB/RepB/Spo0J family partition protein|nr:ParB/RepB/Spo0J family partition protein [Endomicrobium sp.]
MTNLDKLLEKKQIKNKSNKVNKFAQNYVPNVLTTVLEIPIEKIQEDINQPRKDYNTSKITSLAKTIKEKGLIQPIIVKPQGENYLIIAGHRRFMACKELGKSHIACIIRNDSLTESNLKELAMIENLQRDDLTILEIAESIYYFKESKNMSQREISVITGYSEGNISKYISLYSVIKDNLIEQGNIIRQKMGVERAYNHYCKHTSIKARSTTTYTSLNSVIKVDNTHHRRCIERAIEKTEHITKELRNLLENLKNSH